MENSIEHILINYPKGQRGVLVPILEAVQHHHGYITPEAVNEISAYTTASPGEIYGVATFYAHFRFTRPGEHTVKVCLGTACHVRGGDRILEMVEHQLKIKAGETTPDGRVSLERVACIGCCALSPVVVVDQNVHSRMSSTKARKLLSQYDGKEEETV